MSDHDPYSDSHADFVYHALCQTIPDLWHYGHSDIDANCERHDRLCAREVCYKSRDGTHLGEIS